jgi:glucose-1-phosphate cytidylyltransferase
MKTVILAGGYGTRIRDVADDIPKPMIPIGPYPILWHIMKSYSNHGFNDFAIALGYKGDVIKEFFMNYKLHKSDMIISLKSGQIKFQNDTSEDWTIRLHETGANSMTGGRLFSLKKLFKPGDTFMLTYGDGVSDVDIKDLVRKFLDETVTAYVDAATATGVAEQWDLETLWVALKGLYPISFTAEELLNEIGGASALDSDFLLDRILTDANLAYEKRESDLSSTVMRELERKILLSVLDRKWREHLYEMDYLQEGIGLRAMAQRDPLVEYQREGFDLFTAMMDAIKEELVSYLFNAEVQVEGDQVGAKGLTPTPAPVAQLQYSAAEIEPTTPGGTSKNAPCPCGSGKKYKRCHGQV